MPRCLSADGRRALSLLARMPGAVTRGAVAPWLPTDLAALESGGPYRARIVLVRATGRRDSLLPEALCTPESRWPARLNADVRTVSVGHGPLPRALLASAHVVIALADFADLTDEAEAPAHLAEAVRWLAFALEHAGPGRVLLVADGIRRSLSRPGTLADLVALRARELLPASWDPGAALVVHSALALAAARDPGDPVGAAEDWRASRLPELLERVDAAVPGLEALFAETVRREMLRACVLVRRRCAGILATEPVRPPFTGAAQRRARMGAIAALPLAVRLAEELGAARPAECQPVE